MALETGFLILSVDKGEVFSSKNPVSLVGCVSPRRQRNYIPISKLLNEDRN